MNTEFLAHITWVEASMEMQAIDRVALPPFAGPAIRGALGRIFRPALCDAGETCVERCVQPATCRYYALFEQSRASAGQGSNIPKPMVLGAPVPAELLQLAYGGSVEPPYQTGPPAEGEAIPRLSNDSNLVVEAGATVAFELRLLGEVAATMPAIIEALARYGIGLGGARLKLRRVWDGFGVNRLLYDWRSPEMPVQRPVEQNLAGCCRREEVKRLRLVFPTPVLIKLEGGTCYSPEVLGREYLKHCMVRALQVYHAFGRPAEKIPWMELPENGVKLAGHRLFHYSLPRRSFRQQKWMHFDGVVGYMDLAGELSAAMPFVRAAEVLHVGQKATFGLGQVRALVLE